MGVNQNLKVAPKHCLTLFVYFFFIFCAYTSFLPFVKENDDNTLKEKISTSQRNVKYTFASQNTQHLVNVDLTNKSWYFYESHILGTMLLIFTL